MKYFRKIDRVVDPSPLLTAIAAMPELWGEIQVRQQYGGSAHSDTETIYLRAPSTLEGVFDNLESVEYPAIERISSALIGVYEQIAEAVRVRELGRVMIVKLKPGGRIVPHVDEGAYARFFARFHYVLKSHPACLFSAGTETVHMAPGEIWWFNHQVPHSVLNTSEQERIHLIFDATAPGFTGALSLS